jgi:hypothetical protein
VNHRSKQFHPQGFAKVLPAKGKTKFLNKCRQANTNAQQNESDCPDVS